MSEIEIQQIKQKLLGKYNEFFDGHYEPEFKGKLDSFLKRIEQFEKFENDEPVSRKLLLMGLSAEAESFFYRFSMQEYRTQRQIYLDLLSRVFEKLVSEGIKNFFKKT